MVWFTYLGLCFIASFILSLFALPREWWGDNLVGYALFLISQLLAGILFLVVGFWPTFKQKHRFFIMMAALFSITAVATAGYAFATAKLGAARVFVSATIVVSLGGVYIILLQIISPKKR